MRKVLIAVVATGMSLALVSPAEAKTPRHFSIGAHADNRKMDLDSSTGGNRTTNIVGRVKAKGVKLKGKKVRLYATNLHTANGGKRSLGSAKLTSKGRFSKKFAPAEGGQYRIDIVKSSSGRVKGRTKSIVVGVYEWPLLDRFYRDDASNPDPARRLVGRADRELTSSGSYWGMSYAIASGGSAVFDISGFACWRFNMKIGLSRLSRASEGTAVVSQGGRELARINLDRGGFWEPSRSVSETLSPDLPLVVSAPAVDEANGAPVARFVLGNPKASCTYPGRTTPYR
ncbi:hypothetical protein [Aeromicrobium endophyticum]|uniref:Carboxypeptidase regulatory-like domain-containing protein n=1 Tax=Aeromicrobium endophyticum TaxID=2292704 RepID=A0A371PBE9_9ACTN|nr:hypothetical protein [Aeromicrobium endophyticum]REK73251.1 hypothetical protein DX116_06715 [Aeromicrobium endophyticum]